MKIEIVSAIAHQPTVVVAMTLEQARALGTPSVKVTFHDCCAVERECEAAFNELSHALHHAGVHAASREEASHV